MFFNLGPLLGRVRPFFVAWTLLIPLLALAGTPVGSSVPKHLPVSDYVPGEVLVLTSADLNGNGKLDAGERMDGVEKAIHGDVLQRTSFGTQKAVFRVKLRPDNSVQAAIADHWGQGDPRILAVEPNYRVHILGTPDDTRYPEMWSLNNTGQTGGTPDADIDAPEAWDTTTGSDSIIVAVIDTGVDYLHPDLLDNMWHNPGESGGGKETNGIDDDGNGYVDDVYGYDFVMHDSDPSDAHSHGTHVSGTIAARGNNALGTTGINWQCKIMACRFLDAGGGGSTADAITAINYAVTNGARILNNSWGGGGFSASLQTAIENARDHGVLFVAAAGNAAADNDTGGFYPANYPVSNVIAVAATNHNDALSYFSDYGLHTVHLGAPGESILSTVPHYVSLFTEDFQGATPPGFAGTQMTVEGPNPRWGTVLSDIGGSGNIAARADYANSLPYLGSSDGSIVTPTLDTSGLRGLVVSSYIRIDSGAGDSISIDILKDSSWTPLYSLSTTGLYLSFYFIIEAEVPDNLRSASTRFRWRWVTNSNDNNYQGVEIDNINITYIGGDYSNSYALFSGTSMATPHVCGVAALALAADPTLSLSALKTRIMYSGDPIPALQGKTITGRRLNASGAVHPLAPVAFDATALAYAATPVTVPLSAVDDGQPGPLQYAITSLPTKGSLSDSGGPITSVPHTLPIPSVTYTSVPNVNGVDTFQFTADDGGSPPYGGPSTPATVSVTILNCFFFDGFPSTTLNPANWMSGSTVTIDASSLAPPSPPYALRLDGSPAGAESVVSRVMDLSSLHGAELRYWFEQGANLDQPDPGEDLIFEYLTASNTWVELSRQYGEGPAMSTFQPVLVNLPEGAFHPNFQFRIRNLASVGNAADVWYVDDICIQEPPDQPPTATSTIVSTAIDAPVTIALPAFDPNRDPLTYTVLSLPGSGTLSDPHAGAISSVPYMLAGGGNSVLYSPATSFEGNDAFQFKVNDGHTPPVGGDSAVATVSVSVVPCLPEGVNPTPADAAVNASHDPVLTWDLAVPPHNVITFDELPYGTIVNGMVIADVSFIFSSNDATIDGGPGNTLYVQTPNIEGDRAGTLTLEFNTPVAGVGYGFALSAFSTQTDASSMDLYDANNNLIGTFTADAEDHGFSYVEGQNAGSSPLGIARAVITFTHPGAVRFALDNLELTPMPGSESAGSAGMILATSTPGSGGAPVGGSSAWPIAIGGQAAPDDLEMQKIQLEESSSPAASDPAAAAALPDFCTTPQFIIGASPIVVTASQTSAATVSPTDPNMGCGAPPNSNTLWYQIVPAETGSMHISTCNSSYDTVVAVWKGTCSALVSLGCNDDSSCGLASDLTVPVEAGVPYLIEVADYDGPGGGELVMTIAGIDAVCTSPTHYTVLLDKLNPPTTPVCQNLTARSCNPGPAVRTGTTYYWRVQTDNCCGTAMGPIWSFSTNTPADFDHDGDVDLTDFAHLQLCLSGAGFPQNDPACADARLAGNNGVDALDLAIFIKCLNGANLAPLEGCAD